MTSRCVGFDDIPLAAAAAPPLTTVRQPMAEMGRAIATALLEMVGTAPRAAAGAAHGDRAPAQRVTGP